MPLASGNPDEHDLTMIKALLLSSITLKDTTRSTLPCTHIRVNFKTVQQNKQGILFELSRNISQCNIKTLI